MTKGRVLAGALMVSGAAAGAFGGIVETFSYANGPLTTASGGAWQLWDPSASGDGAVSGGVAVINHTTDVARLFPNELQSAGSTVSFSMSVNVATANTANDFTIFFSPASLPLSTGQNYAQSLGFVFDWGTDPGGNVNVGLWPPSGPVNANLGTMTAGTFHTVSGTMTKLAGSISYSVQLDAGLPVTGSFTHTDPNGINAVEMYTQVGTLDGGFMVDNITMTPAPGSLAILGLGGLLAARRRRV